MNSKEIEKCYNDLVESIRQNLSAKLMDYDENNPLEVKIILESETQGLPDVLKATIHKIYQDRTEGIIYVYLDDYWSEFDFLNIEDKIQIIKYLEENEN